jgi:AcrR family transcriptional regulator
MVATRAVAERAGVAPRFGRSPEVCALQRQRTDAKIVAAVMQIVRADGPNAVTMESVSLRSGVAKTTLYRRYQDRYELIRAVAAQLAPIAYPQTGLTAQGLAQMLKDLQDTFETHVGYAFVGQVLSSGEESLGIWREKVIQPRLDAVRTFFDKGVREGVLRTDFDYQTLSECLMGGILVRNALRGKVSPEWADDMVTTIWPLIADSETPLELADAGTLGAENETSPAPTQNTTNTRTPEPNYEMSPAPTRETANTETSDLPSETRPTRETASIGTLVLAGETR